MNFFMSASQPTGVQRVFLCSSIPVVLLTPQRSPSVSSCRFCWVLCLCFIKSFICDLFVDGLESLHASRTYICFTLSQLAFYVNLHRAVIGPSATLTGRWRPDIDLRGMLTGLTAEGEDWDPVKLAKAPSNLLLTVAWRYFHCGTCC